MKEKFKEIQNQAVKSIDSDKFEEFPKIIESCQNLRKEFEKDDIYHNLINFLFNHDVFGRKEQGVNEDSQEISPATEKENETSKECELPLEHRNKVKALELKVEELSTQLENSQTQLLSEKEKKLESLEKNNFLINEKSKLEQAIININQSNKNNLNKISLKLRSLEKEKPNNSGGGSLFGGPSSNGGGLFGSSKTPLIKALDELGL